jgi:hypothetical protein
MRSAPSSCASAAICRMPTFVAGRAIGSSGVASVPLGSEAATPQRALP